MFSGQKNANACHEKVVSYELCFLVFDVCRFENTRLTSALTEVGDSATVDFGNSKAGPSLASLRYVTESSVRDLLHSRRRYKQTSV